MSDFHFRAKVEGLRVESGRISDMRVEPLFEGRKFEAVEA